MCLCCKQNTKFERTTEDKVFYKVLQDHPRFACFMTPYMYAAVNLNEEYKLDDELTRAGMSIPNMYAEIHPYADGEFSVNDGMFHLIKNLKDAKRLRERLQKNSDEYGHDEKFYVAKAFVPAGTLTIEGTFYLESLSSPAPSICVKCVTYTEIVE